jgi:peptidylprolyl isomerase/peptidyl-prolyl cis-trans isomerase A (cyclophilin A)
MPRMTRTPSTLLLAALLLAPAAGGAEQGAGPPRAAAGAGAKKGGEIYAVFVTSRGKIAARLLPGETPNAVRNFVELATGQKEWTDPRTGKPTRAKLYDGTIFHRVIPGFMIQGGDPLGKGTGDIGFRFDDEIPKDGTPFDEPCQLAMANRGPDTNGSQFFITEVKTPHLNPKPCPECKLGVRGYVRFGVGVCGCERVKAIAAAGNGKTRLERVLIVHQKPSCD